MAYLRSKIEWLKWSATFFILLNMLLASFTFVPENFIALAIGTFIYFFVGYFTKDKPLMIINLAGVLLSTVSFVVN